MTTREKEACERSGFCEVKMVLAPDGKKKMVRKSFFHRGEGEIPLANPQQAQSGMARACAAPDKKEQGVKFTEWSETWLELYKKPIVYHNTFVITYLNVVRNHLQPFFGGMELQEIDPAKVREFFAGKTNFSESMIKKMKMCLSAIFEGAMENRLCDRNPAKNVICVSEKRRDERKTYTEEQAKRVKELAWYLPPEIVLMLETGLRKGEMLGLTWEDIDRESKTIHVRRSIADEIGRGIVERPPKWNSTREIPVSDELLGLLAKQPRVGRFVFGKKNGSGPQSPILWARKLNRFMERLPEDIPRLTAHELRHTYGTLLRRRGADIYSIQKVMGHRDVRMTSEIYVHNELDVLRQAIGL